MSNLLNNATSGLLSFQRAISTTSHNIANSRTEGYSRQRVELESRPGERHGWGSPGNGVTVAQLERMTDRFAVRRVIDNTAAHARENTHHLLASRLDSLLADESQGLASAMSGFRSAIEDAAADPGSGSSREAMLAGANALAGRFSTLQSQLDDTRNEVAERMRGELASLNDFASAIADLNARITGAQRPGKEPNDLLDQRDTLINKIASHVDVTTLAREDGSMDLLIGNGAALVLGSRAETLYAVDDPIATARVRIETENRSGGRVSLSGIPLGGSLGGLHDFVDETLDPVRHRLGRIALTTAAEMNEQHALGIDARGRPGGTWLDSAEPIALSGIENTGDATLAARIDEASDLAASDYLLRWDGAAFEVTRRSDGNQSTGTLPLIVDGLELTLQSGTPAVGDTFIVSATAHAAGGLTNLVTQGDALALARALHASDDVANAGDAQLQAPKVVDASNASLNTPVDIVFVDDDSYNLVERSSGTVVEAGVAYSSGAAIIHNGWSTTLEGMPRAGDIHRIDPNTDARGDNGNAIALAERQDAKVIDGRASVVTEHASLITYVGGRTRTLDTRASALETLRDDAIGRVESVSAVNLDEEAIDLAKYEQAYQASAQAIAVADTLFQTILGAVRR